MEPSALYIHSLDLYDLVLYTDFLSAKHPDLQVVYYFAIPMLYHWLHLGKDFTQEDVTTWMKRSPAFQIYAKSIEDADRRFEIPKDIFTDETHNIIDNIIL